MVVEIIAFSRIYGVSRLYRDVEFMLKRELCLFWAFCWGFLVPVFLSFIWIYFTFFTDPLAYKNQTFPESYLCKLRNIFDRELALLVLQGISLWNVSFKLTLTDRNMQVRFCLKVSVYSWGYGIWVSSTSFQKSNIGWPQQPPTETVPYISESLDYLMNHSTRNDQYWSFWCQPVLLFWKLGDETQMP